ncbi:hypothetical protein HO665_06410 [Streptococcus suis]|nr:hypothetical protein [Streptococcus suis]
MKTIQFVFFGFFLLFNCGYILYNLITGFDWSQILLPVAFALFSGWGSYSLFKEMKQAK